MDYASRAAAGLARLLLLIAILNLETLYLESQPLVLDDLPQFLRVLIRHEVPEPPPDLVVGLALEHREFCNLAPLELVVLGDLQQIGLLGRRPAIDYEPRVQDVAELLAHLDVGACLQHFIDVVPFAPSEVLHQDH